jgi:hypothetical protein
MSQGRDVSPALNHSDIVFVAEKQKRSKAKRQRLNISQEHKQRIREKVRAEYHQYLPRGITGAPRATPAGTVGGTPAAR